MAIYKAFTGKSENFITSNELRYQRPWCYGEHITRKNEELAIYEHVFIIIADSTAIRCTARVICAEIEYAPLPCASLYQNSSWFISLLRRRFDCIFIYLLQRHVYVRHNIVQRIQAVEICFYQCVYAYVYVIDIGLMRNANLKDLYKYMTV